MVIGDEARTHRSLALKPFLRQRGAERRWQDRPLCAEPESGIWQSLNEVAWRNAVCADLEEVRSEVRLGVTRVRHPPDGIPGRIAPAGLAV
ncbi:MAG: hypothetical protein C0183_03040 [Roseiflexus castenholzii]|nr:MAG: hypothetical protein C0183_03040 [Roseiflexus castenholzii]